ncbi:MAG: TrkH family potassium uptake protein [Acidobacteriota bacterium]
MLLTEFFWIGAPSSPMNSVKVRGFELPSEAVILVSFVSLIVFGTLVLSLPACHAGSPLPFIDTLFTVTSAACVTGLVVTDTGTHFTRFGQVVILMLIQVGGLGIITLSSFFAILLGKKMPLRQRDIVRRTYSSLDARSFLQLVWRIILFTVAIEAAGAFCLFLAWRRQFRVGLAAWQAIFHAVSAFCNAGFSLFPANLMAYKTDWAVNLVVICLIFTGGIGFLVIYDVERVLRYRGRSRLSLHSKLALLTSFVLIVAGTLMFFLLERGNVLAGLSLPQQMLVSLFQAVVPRTAGFNSIDYAQTTASTMVFTMLLMFIGGSPGSTAGGVKTTTVALFLATAYSRGKGQNSTNILNRTVPDKSVNEAGAIILVAVSLLLLFNFTMQWTETGVTPHGEAAVRFLDTSFETVSAFATVGLSAGITPKLTDWGKLQIILLMLIGRVGPLTIAVMIAKTQRGTTQIEYYRENVMVG